jgi:hypothetical protein
MQASASRHGANYEERLNAANDFVWQRSLRRFMGQVFFACVESDERTAAQRGVVANGPAKHRMARFESVKHRPQCGRRLDFKLHLTLHTGQRAQVIREHDSDHRDSYHGIV